MNFLESFFSELNRSGIKYAVLRNYHLLPESAGTSDLDIFIDTEHFGTFLHILKKVTSQSGGSLVSSYSSGSSYKFCVMGFLASGWGLTIDLFTGSIEYRNQEIISKKLIWANCISYKNIIVVNPKTDALISLVKELLTGQQCSTGRLNAFNDNCCDLEYLRSAFGKGENKFLAENIYRILTEGISAGEKIKELSALLDKAFPKRNLEFLSYIPKLKRIFRQPGYMIVFIGTDGAGKTTLINHIKPLLGQVFHDSVYLEHLRPNLLPSLSRLLKNHDSAVLLPHDKKPSGFLISLFRLAYYTLDYTLGYFIKIFPKRNFKSCIWLFDRYFYDLTIDPERACIKLPRVILNSVQYLLPKPDIIFCLGTEAQKIHERKQELQLSDIKGQVEKLQAMCMSTRRAIWIDTGVTEKSSADDVLNSIYELMAQRFQDISYSKADA